MDIDFASLLVFRRLAESGSFTETAKTSGISQPAVSLMISRLESASGLVLLERTSAGARLTAAGGAFLKRSNEVCDAYLSLIDGMQHLGRRIDRQVLVGLDGSWFCRMLEQSLARTPLGVAAVPILSGSCGNWGEALETSRFDVVVAGRFLHAGLSAGIQEAVIRHERGITIAWNPDFYPFDPVNFSFPEILQATVLLPDRHVITGFDHFLTGWCGEAYGRQPVNAIRFSSEEEAADACLAGLGVLVAPGEAMPRLGRTAAVLTHVRTFEFLLPEAFTLGIYCRSDEDSKDVLSVAAAIGKRARRLFP